MRPHRVRRRPVEEVIVGRVHHKVEKVEFPRQLLLGSNNVGGRIEALFGHRAVLSGEEPRQHAALLAILSGEEAAKLRVINAILFAAHGHDVASSEHLPVVIHSVGRYRPRDRRRRFRRALFLEDGGSSAFGRVFSQLFLLLASVAIVCRLFVRPVK